MERRCPRIAWEFSPCDPHTLAQHPACGFSSLFGSTIARSPHSRVHLSLLLASHALCSILVMASPVWEPLPATTSASAPLAAMTLMPSAPVPSRLDSVPTMTSSSINAPALEADAAVASSDTRGRPPVGEVIDRAEIKRGVLGAKTNQQYDLYISGAGGWKALCEARDIDPDCVDVSTAENIAKYFYWRTNRLTMGKSMGDQICAAIKAHFRHHAAGIHGLSGQVQTPTRPRLSLATRRCQLKSQTW